MSWGIRAGAIDKTNSRAGGVTQKAAGQPGSMCEVLGPRTYAKGRLTSLFVIGSYSEKL
jgi:hypothetical protein